MQQNEGDDNNGLLGAGEDEEKEESPANDQQNPADAGAARAKHKRRSKNDTNGRDFQCGCGKRYLSYPALYTHIKTKHNGVNPGGTHAPTYQNGRGRGRPRKVAANVANQ